MTVVFEEAEIRMLCRRASGFKVSLPAVATARWAYAWHPPFGDRATPLGILHALVAQPDTWPFSRSAACWSGGSDQVSKALFAPCATCRRSPAAQLAGPVARTQWGTLAVLPPRSLRVRWLGPFGAHVDMWATTAGAWRLSQPRRPLPERSYVIEHLYCSLLERERVCGAQHSNAWARVHDYNAQRGAGLHATKKGGPLRGGWALRRTLGDQ